MDILQAIGNTAMVRLRKIVPSHCADIFVKLEWENPTGSMKDRMALAVISRAEQDGRLEPGDTVVEYTGGSTGTSLALVCAVRGYRIQIVTSVRPPSLGTSESSAPRAAMWSRFSRLNASYGCIAAAGAGLDHRLRRRPVLATRSDPDGVREA